MKTIIMAAAMACMTFTTSACATLAGIPETPRAAADKTKLDEQAALSVELAYQGAVALVRAANWAGLVSAANKPKVAAIDNKAYAAVKAVRAAYDAGNSDGYIAAVRRATEAVKELMKLAG